MECGRQFPSHDILTDKKEGRGLMVKSRQICDWLKILPTGLGIQIGIGWDKWWKE